MSSPSASGRPASTAVRSVWVARQVVWSGESRAVVVGEWKEEEGEWKPGEMAADDAEGGGEAAAPS